VECRAGGGIFGIRKTGADACALFYNHLVTVVDEFGHGGRHQPDTILVVFDFLRYPDPHVGSFLVRVQADPRP
jgi:hypothetical protein